MPEETPSRVSPERHIVAGVDFDERARMVIDQALDLAARGDCLLHVVHVAREPGPSLEPDTIYMRPEPVLDQLESDLLELTRARASQAPRVPERGVMVHVMTGDPAESLNTLANELEAESILVGTEQRRGLRRLARRSVAARVVRTATRPVVVLRAKSQAPPIEPACAACIEARRASSGRELWCERHQHNLGRRHTYHFAARTSAILVNMPLLLEQR